MGNVKKKKIYSLQVLRGLAFIGLLAYHCGVGNFGACGTSIFIVLSGFIMTCTYIDKDIECSVINNIKFAIKKISKLYYLHVILTLAIVALAIFVDRSIANIIKQSILLCVHLLLIQSWFPSESVWFSLNCVAWYLSLAVFLYFLFPFILKKIKKIRNNKQAILLSLLIYTVQLLISIVLYCLNDITLINDLSGWIRYIFPVFRAGDFIIGCCFGYVFVNRKKEIGKTKASFYEIITICFSIFVQYIHSEQINLFGTGDMFYTLSSVALVYLFAINKGIISKALTNKFFIHIGDISGYGFLIHNVVIVFVIGFINYINGTSINKFISFICTLIVTILCSEIYKTLEDKVLKTIKIKKDLRNHY